MTLEAEAKGFSCYIVTDKRINIEKLVDDVPSLLAPNIFDNLSSISQYDLKEGCKCIAFERPTAGAFHILRGTEAELKTFYFRKMKTPKKESSGFYILG